MIDDRQEDTPQDEQAPDPAAPEEGSEEPTQAAADPQPEEPVEEPAPQDPVAEEPVEEPPAEQPEADQAPVEEPAAEEAPVEEPAEGPDVEEAPVEEPPVAQEVGEEAAPEAPQAEEAPQAKAPKQRPKGKRKQGGDDEPEVIPGAHLEPDLVLEDASGDRGGLGELAGAEIEAAEQALEEDGGTGDGATEDAPAEPAPAPTTVLELAADARYRATGKRKRAVARVILKPGTGSYTINGRELDVFFPRPTLQTIARQPLQAVGQAERMDVVAKIHGGGVSAQAGALRHGIARALVEADPNLRGELKGRGYLTRDARVKERKKAGLKKARKRPQFSKR